jgi:hypothetical protein
MRVILSRKGFDVRYGGHPSPVLPDSRMISIPIPSIEDVTTYEELTLNYGKYRTYYDLMKELYHEIHLKGRPEKLKKDMKCHLDPDIYRDVVERQECWRPIFGQTGAAQSHLQNKGVGEGDIFLFFGTFRKTKFSHGKLVFDRKDKEKHVIFGYLQIGEIIPLNEEGSVPEWIRYHSHAITYRGAKNNTIYIARDRLSFDRELPGAGTFIFDRSLILTKEGYTKSRWDLPGFFRGVGMSYHSVLNWKKDYFQSSLIGQEFIIKEDNRVEEWAKEIILKNGKRMQKRLEDYS